jgi:methionyl-tRNA formyltransferase
MHHEIVGVITRPDSKSGRSGEYVATPVAKTAEELGLPVIKSKSLTPEVAKQIQELGAQLGIVIAYGGILPPVVLAVHEWWNLHFSLLPQWRGAAPLQQSMISNRGVGISVFRIAQGLDTGDLIAQRELGFFAEETAGEALLRFTELGVDLLLEILDSKPLYTPQQGEASYAAKLSRADAKLSFDQQSMQVDRLVRAFNPEPIAWANCLGHQIRILRARNVGKYPNLGEIPSKPGAVFTAKDKIFVRCGEGTALELLVVQPAGKKAMSATDWFRGQRGEIYFD